jgi:hypothetical protein
MSRAIAPLLGLGDLSLVTPLPVGTEVRGEGGSDAVKWEHVQQIEKLKRNGLSYTGLVAADGRIFRRLRETVAGRHCAMATEQFGILECCFTGAVFPATTE